MTSRASDGRLTKCIEELFEVAEDIDNEHASQRQVLLTLFCLMQTVITMQKS